MILHLIATGMRWGCTSHTPPSTSCSIGGLRLDVWMTIFLVSIMACGSQQPLCAQDAPAQEEPTADEFLNSGSSDEEFFEDDSFDEMELFELEIPVVISASRREQKLDHVSHAMSVITADDIRQSGASSIPDALRLAAGIDVADLSFGAAAVSPRGFHGFISNQVLVLVDGRQIYDSLFGGTLWNSWPFQLEDIARIEVIRGPGGVTWGANAGNGVINIITKDPKDQLGFNSKSHGGSRGTFGQYLSYGWQEDDLRMRVSGEYLASDGFRKGGSFLRNLEDDYKTGRLSLHAVYDKGEDDSFVVSAGSALVDGGFAPTPLAGIGLRRNSTAQASFLLGTWTHKISKDNQFELKGYVNDFHASPGVPSIDYRYQQFALQFSHTFKPDDSRTTIWGIDTRADILDASNSDPFMLSKDFVSTGIVGIYWQEEWQFAPRWTLDLGARIDYEFYGGFQPSARASLLYELTDNSVLYGSVSRAFHMPVAAARFLDMPLVNGLVRVTADRDVEPTTLIAYEMGWRGKFFNRLNASVNVFWHDYDEVATLSPELGPPGLLQNRFDNRSGGASLYGAEFETTYAATDELTLVGNYSYQQLDWSASAPYTERDLIEPPKHKFMLGARYAANEDLRLSAHLYYVDATRAPNPANPFVPQSIAPYFRLDLRAEQEFWDDRASIAVGVRNLLDSGHLEGSTLFLNDAETPRTIYAELRFSIK